MGMLTVVDFGEIRERRKWMGRQRVKSLVEVDLQRGYLSEP